jgi:hypothetical protein
MFDDFKELLSIFNARGVKYLVVGGYAVSLHAQPRATDDIDLLIRPDAENANAVYSALAQFGPPLGKLSAQELIERGSSAKSRFRLCLLNTPASRTKNARRRLMRIAPLGMWHSHSWLCSGDAAAQARVPVPLVVT